MPAEHILLESRSTNIGDNIQRTHELLRDKQVAVKRIIMVSKPSTERRMFATCQRLWPEMTVTFASPLIDLSEQLRGGIGEGLIHEMVGDIQRIKEYPARGFQIPQEIPRNVWRAYEELITLGFDKHLTG